jgi:putative acetyltransferase
MAISNCSVSPNSENLQGFSVRCVLAKLSNNHTPPIPPTVVYKPILDTLMIRKHTAKDLEQIINVWYTSSTLAHPFLSAAFVEKVKSDMTNIYIPNSETWVYEIDNSIVGFISMLDNEIGGLFVLPNNHSKGIGTELVDFIKKEYSELEVEVFEKNSIGRAFYDSYGFERIKKYTHEESGNEVLRLKLIY